jgi:hypothetical protein
MKRYTLIAVAVAGSLFASGAAHADDARVRIGAVAGISASMVAEDSDTWDRPAVGFMVGASATGRVSPLWHWRVELAYARRGARGDVQGEPLRIDMSYLELPVLAEVRFSRQARVRPRLLAGLAVSRNLSGRFDSDLTVAGPPLRKLAFDLPMRDWTFSALAGAGLDIDVGQQRITVELRFTQGLQNMYAEPDYGPFGNIGGVGPPVEVGPIPGLWFGPSKQRSLSIVSSVSF